MWLHRHVPRVRGSLGALHCEVADVRAQLDDPGRPAAEVPPPRQQLGLPTLLAEPVQLLQYQRVRVDEAQGGMVGEVERPYRPRDAATPEHCAHGMKRWIQYVPRPPRPAERG